MLKKPACLVTFSSSKSKFSTGFDIQHWLDSGPMNPLLSIPLYGVMLTRIATFPMPTMALIDGHCYAGGIFFAIAHDFRIMRNPSRFKLCLTEAVLGFEVPLTNSILIQSVMKPQAVRTLMLGQVVNVP